jgi:hypothetical protein
MAQGGAIAAREDRRHPPPLPTHTAVPDGVHTAVKAVQAAGLDAAGQALAMNAGALELLQRNDPMLPGRKSSDHAVLSAAGDFLTHARE